MLQTSWQKGKEGNNGLIKTKHLTFASTQSGAAAGIKAVH